MLHESGLTSEQGYGMPMDDDEMDRMDLQHRKYELVIGDKHFLAPIGPSPQRILDLGTGTGRKPVFVRVVLACR